MADTQIATKAQLENRLENVNAQKKESKGQLSQVMGAAFGGFACGYLVQKNPSLAGIGPGKKLHLRHVIAAAGIYLGRKKGRTGQLARGAGLGAIFALAEGYGQRQAVA